MNGSRWILDESMNWTIGQKPISLAMTEGFERHISNRGCTNKNDALSKIEILPATNTNKGTFPQYTVGVMLWMKHNSNIKAT